MAISQEMLNALIAVRGPYLYHGGQPEQRETYLREGLLPRAVTGRGNSTWSAKGPQFASRPGHVYLGTLSHLDRLELEPLVQVDLCELDPSLICTDEDVFWELMLQGQTDDWRLSLKLTGKPEEALYPQFYIPSRAIGPSSIPEFFDRMQEWMKAGCSFGDWADVYASLIDHSDWVALSIAYGSVAYQGPVPTTALSAYELSPEVGASQQAE